MNQLVSIQTALILPAPEIEALIQGRTIAALPRLFIRPGQRFALYPSNFPSVSIPIERYYCTSFLPIAQTSLNHLNPETVLIKAWAKCELCLIKDETVSLDALSRLTIWTKEGLQELLRERQHIFLACLRVYNLPQPILISPNCNSQEKIGKLIGLSNFNSVSEANAVLSDAFGWALPNRLFTQRRQQLEKLEPPLHPELEELQAMISQINHPAAEQLDDEIKQFLGWTTNTPSIFSNPKLAWIKNIKALGERSKEQDTEKSNYQAGTDFENIVRDSLEFIGFTVDYSHKGGAGGLDLFCSKPYPLVGECKAGKKIPNATAVQLLNLGTLRLKNEELLKQTAKLIIGPGEPTQQLEDAAKVHSMSIINPETLENLVKLQAVYRNSIDLFKLKEYLKPGQSDDEVKKYIEQVSSQIKLRAQIVELVKKQIENTGDDKVSVDSLHGAYSFSNPTHPLKREEMHEILVELSSPLTGYLGRIKGSDWGRDRFYFLRDLSVD